MIWLLLLLISPLNYAFKFYEHANWKGHYIEPHFKKHKCYNFPNEWNDRISSVDTANKCIVVFEDINCKGKSSRIAPGTPNHGHLGEIGFNDVITSAKLCTNSGGGDGGGSTGGDDAEFMKVAVAEHNKYRKIHGSPPLVIDYEASASAQNWANHLAAHKMFKHSDSPGFGENLAATGPKNKAEAVRNAVKMWYNEEKKYDYNKPGYSDAVGHFTAVVWRNTKALGIGVAWDPARRWSLVVARYSPAGNMLGQFEENVSRPL